MGRGRGGGDHCLSKEDKEDKEGIPIPPSKPKIWSMAELAVCKTPPLGSSPLTSAPSLSGGGSPWQQNSGFGGLSNPAGGLMRQNPAAVAAALRTTWNGMNLLGGAATATSSTTMAADLSMGALYSEMTAAAGPEEMSGDSQAAGGYSGNVDETAASPSPHSPLNNSRKLGGGGALHHDSLHPHHHIHHQQLSTASNNSSSSSHHSPHVIANNSHGLQHHFHSTAYHQHQHHHQHHQSHNHHFGLTEGGSGSMMPLSGGGGGGYLADRLKMAASSLAASSGGGGGLYEEEDEQDKVPSSLNMQGVYEGNVNKLASSYEAGLSMLTGPCYGDRL
jgi:hypothetical protein